MTPFAPFSLNIRGKLLTADHPLVMGIINATPDSFFAGSRTMAEADISRRVEKMITDGADIIDVGAYSSRPGADDVSAEEETARLRTAMAALRRIAPQIPVSIDTFRADVARRAIEEMGADIINDISGGTLDDAMFDTIAALKVPYILMHMRGTPATMQSLCEYPEGVAAGVVEELSHKVSRLETMGVADVIIDPGFGFSKTLEQNYELMNALQHIIDIFRKPVLVGISRKSMLTRLLDIEPTDALCPTTALNMAALERGASILRVHDPAPARQAIAIASQLNKSPRTPHL